MDAVEVESSARFRGGAAPCRSEPEERKGRVGQGGGPGRGATRAEGRRVIRYSYPGQGNRSLLENSARRWRGLFIFQRGRAQFCCLSLSRQRVRGREAGGGSSWRWKERAEDTKFALLRGDETRATLTRPGYGGGGGGRGETREEERRDETRAQPSPIGRDPLYQQYRSLLLDYLSGLNGLSRV